MNSPIITAKRRYDRVLARYKIAQQKSKEAYFRYRKFMLQEGCCRAVYEVYEELREFEQRLYLEVLKAEENLWHQESEPVQK